MADEGPGQHDEGLIDGILSAAPQAVPSGQKSELLTFLFADIRGYTRFTQQYGDEAAAKLTAKFASVVREIVTQFDGTVFELRGDEAMCVFASPRQSLRAAVALQRRFVDETVSEEALPMTVGIGLDAGEAVRSDDGYRGGALNLAARLCSKAQAGEVLATNEVTHLARRIDGIRYAVQGSLELKGIADPVRPVRVMPEGEDPAQQLAALLAGGPAGPNPAPPWLPWMPGGLGRLSRRTLATITAIVVLAVAGVVVGITATGGGGRDIAVSENSVGIVNPDNGRVVGDVAVQDNPTAEAAGFGALWTTNTGANTVSRINASNRQVTTTGVGTAPSAVVTGLGAVWVANSASGTVTRIDPATNNTQTIAVGTAPGGLTVAAGSVWVTNTGDGTVSRIDPTTDAVVQTIPVGDGPSGIAGNATSVWVADSASNAISQIPLTAGHAVASAVRPIPVGNDPTGVAVVGTNVWVTNNLDGTVDRIATTGNSVSGSVAVGGEPTQITSLDGRLWVSNQTGRALDEIDPAAARLVRTLPVGVVPGGLAAANHRIWVSATVNPLLHSGGTLRIVGPDPTPVDPAYKGEPWSVALDTLVYDGLVDYRHTAGADASAVVPDLATDIPQPRNGGRTYSFQLRAGIRWSTGAPLTVDDVQRGLERAIASGFTPLATEIVGAGHCTLKHCAVSGIAVQPAARSIAITLVRPNVVFLDQLAAFAVAVPAATPLAQTNRPIPGTGPYEFAAIKPGKQVVLVRNRFFREWSAAAQPAGFPDQITDQITGPTPGGAVGGRDVAAVAQGRYDVTDARGAGTAGSLQAEFGSRIDVTPTETTQGVILNTGVAPFSNPLARRALAYAIDRSAVAANWFTNATVTCQVLPPDYPGHRPYCPFTGQPNPNGTWNGANVARAQHMVARSGTRNAKVVVYTAQPVAAGIRGVVTAMRQIGYRASLKVDNSPNYFGYVADSRHRVQASFFGWVADDISASDFFVGLFDCASFNPASPNNDNPSQFCDPSLDRLMNRALRVQSTSRVTADALWAQVDRQVSDAAPFIPLVNPSWVDVVSRRVHNYQRSPVLGLLYDQMWVR
jgi:peptide/nickel transport system substrate-binding protein